jgi:hypothetical protein
MDANSIIMSQEATQLFVYWHGLDEKAEQKIANLMDEYEFPVTSTEGKTGEMNTLMTNGFINDDQHEANIDSLFEVIEKEYEEMEISRSIGEYPNVPFDWIYEFLIRDEDWVEAQDYGS